jgi:hypothetical protein
MIRSVPGGRCRCSWCCRLIVDLLSHLIDRSWARRLTHSPELGTKHAAKQRVFACRCDGVMKKSHPASGFLAVEFA